MLDVNYEDKTMKVIIDGKEKRRPIDVTSCRVPLLGDEKTTPFLRMQSITPLLYENEFLVYTMKDKFYHIFKK